MAWVNAIYQSFDAETLGALPSGWTSMGSSSPSTLVVGTPPLSGARGLVLTDAPFTSSWGLPRPPVEYTRVEASGSPWVYGKISISGASWNPSWSTVAGYWQVNFEVRSESSTLALCGIRYSKPDSSIAQELYIQDGATQLKVADLSPKSIYNLQLYYNSNTGKSYVIANGTTYNNGGSYYNAAGAGNAYGIALTTECSPWDMGSSSGTVLVDEAYLVKWDSPYTYPGTGLSMWTNPYSPNGSNGWYLSSPSGYARFAEGSGNCYMSVGTATNPTAYIGYSSAFVSYNADTLIFNSTSAAACESSSGAYLYCGLSTGVADMSSISIPWTSGVPSVGNIVITGASGVSDTAVYNKRSGYIQVDNLRGTTSTLPAGKYHMGIERIDIKADGKTAISVSVVSGAPPISVTPSGSVTYPGRVYSGSLGTTTTIPFQVYTAGADLDHNYWSLSIPYNEDDILADATFIQAVVYSEAGSITRSSLLYLSRAAGPPLIDRIYVYANQTSGVYDYRIIGHVNHTIPVSRVEFTKDRRVPILSIPLSGGVLETTDGEPPCSYILPSAYIVNRTVGG